MFSLPGFLVLRTLGERQGVTNQDALNRVSLIGGMLGMSLMGIIVGKTLIDREVDAQAPATTATTSVTTSDVKFAVPPVVGSKLDAAERILTADPYHFIVKPDYVVDPKSPAGDKDKVTAQDPEANKPLRAGGTVTLTVNEHDVPTGGSLFQDAKQKIASGLEELNSVSNLS